MADNVSFNEDTVYLNHQKFQKYFKNVNTSIMGWGQWELEDLKDEYIIEKHNNKVKTNTLEHLNKLKRFNELISTAKEKR
jgi:hypothetical protein